MSKSKRVRVLHVAEAAGGVERYLENLFKYSEDTVDNILVCSQNYDIKKFKNIVSHIEQIKMAHEISFTQDISSTRIIRSLIKKYKPDIVYAHSSKAGALTRLANIGFSNKCLYNPHGWSFNEKPYGIKGKVKNSLFKFVEKVQTPFTDKIVCVSNFEKETAIYNNIANKDKLCVIYSGIDFSKFHKQNIDKRSEDEFVVGMVARITQTKAPDIFVKAAAEIKKKIPNSFFYIVGDGDLRYQIETLISKLNLKNSVEITGWVNNPTDYMKKFDVGLLLSRWEGFGLVLPEYMYSGVPIVASNSGGIPDIIRDRYNGLIVPADNVKSTVDAILKIHNNVNLRDNLIRNGKEDVVKRFNVKREVRQTIDLYVKLLGE